MKRLLVFFLLLSLFESQAQEVAIKLDSGIVAEWVEPEKVFDQTKLSSSDVASIAADKEFLSSLPNSYDNVSPAGMKNLINQLDDQLERLVKEKETLLKNHASQEAIDSKTGTISVVGKEKKIINLTIEKNKLTEEADVLGIQKEKLKKYLIILAIVLAILVLAVMVMIQRKTIKFKDNEIENQLDDINKKNHYLEHAAKIIRHDMHSGINTYMPRGIASLEKRVTEDQLKELKIDGSIKMIKEGLAHTQKVYKSVYEFTNLVKPDSVLEKTVVNLKEVLLDYVANTAYTNQIEIDELVEANVNSSLFCTAIDNLIRNGLKYNDAEKKVVKIYMESKTLIVEDNGRGLSSEEFEKIRKNKTKGLGLSISLAILQEHGFSVSCEKINLGGTRIKINIV